MCMLFPKCFFFFFTLSRSSLEDVVRAVQNMETSRDSVSHMLVHLKPIDNYKKYKLVFASDYIQDKVTTKYLKDETQKFLHFLKVTLLFKIRKFSLGQGIW